MRKRRQGGEPFNHSIGTTYWSALLSAQYFVCSFDYRMRYQIPDTRYQIPNTTWACPLPARDPTARGRAIRYYSSPRPRARPSLRGIRFYPSRAPFAKDVPTRHDTQYLSWRSQYHAGSVAVPSRFLFHRTIIVSYKV